MELKDYQEAVLERLSSYLDVLKKAKQNASDLEEIRKKRNDTIDWSDKGLNFPDQAWDWINRDHLLPPMNDKEGTRKAEHKNRFNGIGLPVPNICLKVPTGGGKTLLGAFSIERVNNDFFGRRTGLILWVVPSDAIYKQTMGILSNRDHLYRHVLDRSSGGRVKILKKTDGFHPQDVNDFLCVMILMLQSAGGKTKEILKLFRDSGKFPHFFPDVENHLTNKMLLDKVKNLDACSPSDMKDDHHGRVSIKHSLGNVLRMINPVIVIDEGHRAYTEKAKETLLGFNPKFILELSATPNKKEHHSNVLVAVSGNELKREQMIKIPINILNLENNKWKKILSEGYRVLGELSRKAKRLDRHKGRYIRPIMLIRVERTGNDQRDKGFIHSEDVRGYLIKTLNIEPEEIKVKSSTRDELGKENLLSRYSKVRYIITKEALKEGWDCSFAYVLAILSKTKAPVAIEQMLGRVLRQPQARRTEVSALDQCYVICMDQDVAEAIEGIKKGLQGEGMDGLAGDIKSLNDQEMEKKKVKRRKGFKGLQIFLPKVLHRSDKTLRELSYERDLLFHIDWAKMEFNKNLYLSEKSDKISYTTVDIKDNLNIVSSTAKGIEQNMDEKIDFAHLCQGLSDTIPNPWDAATIVDETFSFLKKRGHSKRSLYNNRYHILDSLKSELKSQISLRTEKIFREKLRKNEILFKLISAGDPELNWEMKKTIDLSVSKKSQILSRKHGQPIQRSLFEDIYEEEFKINPLEKNVAWYLDEHTAIKWWHRLIEKQDWHLQGWQKNKIYPDFLICLRSFRNGDASFSILETKGEHLLGNVDTEYKRKLFKLFTDYSKNAIDAGDIEIQDKKMTFNLIFQNGWKDQIEKIFEKI